MMRWIKVGDTKFIDKQVDNFRFYEEKSAWSPAADSRPKAGRCCSGSPRRRCRRQLNLGGLVPGNDRVLPEAAISGKVEYLCGLKENAMMKLQESGWSTAATSG